MSRALDLLAALVLEDGRRWGDAARPFQWDDARHVLDGPERLAYLTRPRGASKTTDLAGIAVAALLTQLPEASRSYAVAADRDQGALLVDAVDGFARRTPELAGAGLRVDQWRVTATKTGASLEVLAADSASAFGLRPHLLIADERAQWRTTPEPERLWSALWSALPKVPGSRLVILTSAGDPSHPAYRLLQRARRSPRWWVSELPGPCPWLSPDDLAEQRSGLTDSEFARFHLNQWSEPEDRLALAADLEACAVLDGPLGYEPGYRYVIGLDIGLKRDRTVAAVCHVVMVGERRQVVLDRIAVWKGSPARPVSLHEVERWLLAASAQYRSARVVADPYQAVGLLQRLSAQGVPNEEFVFSAGSAGRLAKTLHDLVREHDLRLPRDRELLDELGRVRLRESSPGVFRLDHAAGDHDDRAVAIALAAQHLLRGPGAGAAPAGVYSGSVLPGLGAAPVLAGRGF